jgi:hypothetical protein
MSKNTDPLNITNLRSDWRKLRETAAEQLIQTRALLRKLDSTPGTSSSAKKEIESLANQLTGICNQIDAQFLVVQNAMQESDNETFEHQVEILIQKFQGWYTFLNIGSIERKDFISLWLQAWGVSQENKNPEMANYLGLSPKNFAACQAWEKALLFPRRASSILEVGSGFGINAIRLSCMARVGTIEKKEKVFQFSRNIEKISPIYGRTPPISFSHCDFQLKSVTTIPTDLYDAIWFHSSIWKQWIEQDGPGLISAISELARRAHFLLFTSNDEKLLREDLLSPLYEIESIGSNNQDVQKKFYFIAQRRYVDVAGKFFPCSDMRIHDPTCQGFETLNYKAAFLPWNKPSVKLNTKRYIVGKNQVLRTFLKRTQDADPSFIHHRETQIWPSLYELAPEFPKIVGHFEDDIGYHLLLELNGSSAQLPMFPLNMDTQHIILCSAIRILSALRKKNLHLNFLRLGNFALSGSFASLLAGEFIGYDEIEEPLDALLWLLRDLSADIIYWHDSPIESFRSELVDQLAEEYKIIANLALRSKNIDQFLADPLVQHRFLNPL